MPARPDRVCGRSLTIAPFAAAILATAAGAESPVPSWTGVKQVVLLCQATAQAPIEHEAVTKAVCQRAAAIASRQSPVPVKVVDYGDPALNSADTASLFIQAAVTEVAPRRLGLVFAARTENQSAIHPDASYFGATPRVAPFTSATDPAAWDPALAASLQELLPWMKGMNG